MNHVKAELAATVVRCLEGTTQTEAAELIGATQANMSRLRRGQLQGISTDRLLCWLSALGQDVEIRVKSKRSSGPQ